MILYFYLCFFILLISFFKDSTLLNNIYTNRLILSLLILFLTYSFSVGVDSFVIGDSAISDTVIYVRNFYDYGVLPLMEVLRISDHEPLFLIFSWIVYQIYPDHNFYLTLIWLIFNVVLIFSLKRIFENRIPLIFVYISFILLPFLLPYLINGIRQGFAMLFLLLIISLLNNEKYGYKAFFFSVISIGFHLTSLPFVFAIYLVGKFKFQTKILIIVWLISALLYLTGLNELLISFILNLTGINVLSHFSGYTDLDNAVGLNNPLYLLFSFLIVLYGTIFRRKIGSNKIYIFNLYLAFNILFLLLGFVAYANRISAYSWFLIPIIIWLPFSRENTFIKPIVLAFVILVGFFTSSANYFGF